MTDATVNAANPPIPFAASGPGATALDSDAALMARVQAGDLDAFEPLVQRYERRLFGYFLNLVEDPATAADLAQETFVRVYRATPRYRESGKFESWLFRIASNLVRSRRRRPDQRMRHLPLEDVPAGASELAAGGREARPDEATWRAEVRDALQKALPRLPLAFREAVLLRDVEGRSYREIAEMLGVEEGTAKSRAHRGRKHLRELLAPMFEDAVTDKSCYEGVS
jgi:RNA polymerase sigma-70 factor (ECF subfamily)